MIRLAGLFQQQDSGYNKRDDSGLTVDEQIKEISTFVHKMVRNQYRVWRSIMATFAEQHEVEFVKIDDLDKRSREWLSIYYYENFYPIITPLAVDAGHPFPFLANKSLNLAIRLVAKDGEEKTAVIPVPRGLPRLVRVAPALGLSYLFLEDIIERFADQFFVGYRILETAAFRITRNSDLSIDEDDAEDLLQEVEKSLLQRKRGDAVRLEIDRKASLGLREFLLESLELTANDLYEINGAIDLTLYSSFIDSVPLPHLRWTPQPPLPCPEIPEECDVFEAIKQRDILLHHPYMSFEPVINFVKKAAADPGVLAIKQTLYRVSGDSPIIAALSEAAENGKQVTVLVELKARFDEEKNIRWARRLEKSGCHVIYGLVGLKTHAKMILVVRQEQGGIKRYVHMGTGNYNDSTARLYTDMGLFTANDQFGIDASAFFNVLSGYSDPPIWNKVAVAPIGLREELIDLIDQEINFAKQGLPARIIAKMNSLADKRIAIKLYEASCSGVDIDLIVRGICVLRPSVKNVSENIRVQSIVGRYLEHSRIYYFAAGGDEKLFLSSADWMPRNLDRRVELLFPIEDSEHFQYILQVLELMLRDNVGAYNMLERGSYRRIEQRGEVVGSQQELYNQVKQMNEVKNAIRNRIFRPMWGENKSE